MRRFSHFQYVLQNRKTGAIVQFNSQFHKDQACFDNGLIGNDFKIVSKDAIYTRDDVYTGVTKKQLMQLLATLDDDDVVPFKVANYHSCYAVDNDDDGDGLCLDMQDNTLVYYDITYDHTAY